jgi:hypothetical protein
MKKSVIIPIFLCGLLAVQEKVHAQVPVVSVVSGIIKKVIIAIDLQVQKLQNETIQLQNAERSVENNLHLNSLNDINGWLTKEKALYQQYYKELATVRTVIADYDEVRRIIGQQEELLTEYHDANNLFRQDRHFTASELNQMSNVYSGILQESARNLQEVVTAVKSFSTQMKDAERLLLIHHATAGMQKNLDDLRQFNNHNVALSLARAGEEQDRAQVRELYGL